MQGKKVVSMLLAAAMILTSVPGVNGNAAVQTKDTRRDRMAENSKFEIQFDSSTGAITSMKLDNDPNKGNSDLELNWVNGSKNSSGNGVDFGDTTWGMGPLYNSQTPNVTITASKSDATFQTDNTKVHIVRELTENDTVLEETYTFTNTSDSAVDYQEGEFGIYVPFNDYYEASNLSTERRCNTHIWAGEDYSYIYAVRMGGDGPHVGLVLTQGSMASYGQVGYNRADSNDRGKFIFNNDAMTLEPNESYTVAWKVFAHDGEEDFYQKLDEQTDFVRLESDYYTKEKDQGEAFSITAVSTIDLEGASLQARKVSYRNKAVSLSDSSPVYGDPVDISANISGKKLTAEFKPNETGEYVVELITAAGKKAICKLNYVSSMDNLLKNRVTYILDHQQMLDASDSDRYGGFFPYNTQTGELELKNGSLDHSGARERLAMPITLALYYQVTEDNELKGRIKTSLELFWEYAKREIINTSTGQCFDSINYGGGGREYNSPNYAWMCMEMYKVTGKTECIDVMMQILRYLRDTYGRRTAYIINMNMLENLEFLYELKRYDDYLELYAYYVQCGDWIVEDLPNYPSLEVKYEQSIVTPTVENIAAVYYLTRDEKYKEAVETHYRRMMALEGNQPSYFQNRIGIRHWDDYWFGADDNTCGDTLHYWSALDARALKVYDMCMGTDHSKNIRNIYMNNLANIAEDGRGFCSYLIAKQNNNINGERYNMLANDQDYALAIALKNYIMPQTIQEKYVIHYHANNVWVKEKESTVIIEVPKGADGAKIASFPNIDLEDNHVLSWNTKKDGSGKTITSDTLIRENLTLYAQWATPVEDIVGEALVKGKLAETSGQVNLTEEGSSDWVQFGTKDLGNCAHKDLERQLITNISAIQGVSDKATDGKFTYVYSDAAEGTMPVDNCGIVAKGMDNGFEFELPSGSKMQKLKVYAGVWGGDVTFELLVNGIVQYQGTFGKDTTSGAVSQCFEVQYRIPESVNTITGRLYCTKNLDEQWGGCSVILQAITLGEGIIAGEDDEFEEVAVPNGDFESGSASWTFTGGTEDSAGATDTYWRIFGHAGNTNTSNVYEACTHNTQSATEYTCSQTVTGLTPGVYKASVQASGGNDPGAYKASFTAGGKSVSVNPSAWNNFITYMTDTFEVGNDGVCEIVFRSEISNNYINVDNVKLYRQVPQGPKEVDKVQPVSQKVAVGGTFTAPTKATVLYTNGKSEQFDVTWDAAGLAAVSTAAAGSFTVNGKVIVEGTEYDVVMTVEVVDSSGLVQHVGEDAIGSVDFDENWKFYLATRTPQEADGGFAAAGVKDAGDYTTAQIIAEDFNDMSFRTLDVPHDFSIEGEKVSSSQDSQAYLQGGLGYYRKKFTVPVSMQGERRISIDFEGVYQNSVIYLNGEKIGSYPNGYTGFSLDITDKIEYGAENILVVKVQNMSPSGRWYTGSGIVRPVHLVIDNLACFNRNGIVLSAPSLESDYTADKKAYLAVTGTGYSKASNSNVYMKVTVFDADGNQVAEKETGRTAINPNTKFELSLAGNQSVEIPNVKLWYPWNMGNPYLYTVKVDLYGEVNGTAGGYQLIDSEEMEYGFRWAEVKETTSDPSSGGLYINGTYTKVQGVDLHHDAGAVGAASYADAYEREFQKLMDMGVNAYRTSHCPPSKQAIEVCRRKGILVVEEAYDGWGRPKATYDFGNFFFEEVPADWAGLLPNGYTSLPTPGISYDGVKFTWSDWVIQEMVKRDQNEPSVIAWSIGNEVRGTGTKPAWYDVTKYDSLGVSPGGMNEYTEAVRLKEDIKAIDNTHYVLMGGDQERTVPGVSGVWGLVNQVLDGYGLNYNTASSVDGLISRFSVGETGGNALLEKGTKTFFFESESSSQTSSRGVYLDPQFGNTGINQTPGRRGGSNYDNDFASWTMSNEYGLKKDRDRKAFIGQFIWSGFDYLGEPTPYSIYPVGVSSFGTIDTAGFPKDSFYLYQSQWIKKPMVHVLPTNWDQWHEGETVTVWVNTNQPSAELFLNGKSLGKKSFDEKETADGRKYYETSEKTQDDKTWNDSTNPGGYTSKGAKLDAGELNSGKLHLTWEVPYEPGTLSVKAYGSDGTETAADSVTTSSTPYTIEAKADKTVLAADGSSLSYVECTIVDEAGNMVPDAQNLVQFQITGAASIFGVDNGKQENAELYKYGNTESSSRSERTAYNGKVLVILKSGREAGDAVLTISSKDLKPVQIPITVTEDGTGNAPAAITVTGTEQSVEPVVMKTPAGIRPVLPSAVRVNYNSNAGEYSVMKKVTWGVLANGAAEGTVEGCTLKAAATVTEDASVQMDTELATGKAQATASFTGSVNNYPANMVDGQAGTTWTNMYTRGASVLLPENSASRKNEYVEFSWDQAQLLNKITLNFTGSRGTAVPAVLEAEYFDGSDWKKTPGQTLLPQETEAVSAIQFRPVYTDKVRVYMENETPFTENGNIEISEVSVMLSSDKLGAWAILSEAEAVCKETAVSKLQFIDLPAEKTVKEIRFSLNYDKTVFENPEVTLTDREAGTLKTEQIDGKTVYIWTAGAGNADLENFAEIALTVKEDAVVGRYTLAMEGLTVTDADGNAVEVAASETTVTVKENQLEARREALKSAIEAAKKLDAINYTDDSYHALLEAIKSAEEVSKDETATQAAIEEQLAKLAKAVSDLKTPDLEELQRRLEQLLKEKQAAEAAKKKAEEEKQAALNEIERLKKAGVGAQPLKAGMIEEAGGVIYRVTDAAKKEAAAYGVVRADTKKIKIADAVTINGTVCLVTSIGNSPFQSLVKVKQITVGRNVATIGTKAFFGDKNLKKIQFTGTKLKKVGKNALKNISAKATIKVPKSKKKKYTKLFKGRGQKKSVKVK